ncbi:MAG: hypothetical protein U0269_22935 [Polyangiales bacterium]
MSAAVKGAVIRSQLSGLDLLGIRDSVVRALPARTKALVAEPPSIVEWVAIEHSFDLAIAVSEKHGAAMVERWGKSGGDKLVTGALRPIVTGIFGVFGADVHSLLARNELLMKAIFRGMSLRYEKTGDHSCDCTLTVEVEAVPDEYWFAWKGVLLHSFSLCKREGAVTLHDDASRTQARYSLAWR